MISNSGFPFAPDYLNSLRLGPQVEEVLPSKRKVSKARKIATTATALKQARKKTKTSNNLVASSGAKSSVAAPCVKVVDVASWQLLPVTANTTAKLPERVLLPHFISKQEYPRNFGSITSAPSTCRFHNCCYSLIVTLSTDDIKTISGFCSVNLLKGHISINGLSLKVGVETEIMNPCWLPAVSLIPESSSSSSSTPRKTNCIEVISEILDSVGLTLKNNLSDPKMIEWINNSECLVLVRGIPRDRQEWLIAAEDQSLYQEYSRPLFPFNESENASILADNDSLQPKYWWADTRNPGNNNIFGVTSAVIGNPYDISRTLGAELLDYPPCWISSVDDIIKESSVEKCVSSSTVVCGAKGVGKSTCVRYLVNRLLSKTDAVAVIDCDLGQPEFTTPGLLSLHIITEPILSPSHMHIKEPLLSYFIGDITSKNEPELFAKALTALTAKYHRLQSDLLKKNEKLQRRNDSEVNSFSMLSDRKYKPRMMPLPLVVNTDGSIRFMGAEVLTAVMEIVQPTHVMHISSEKDRDLPAVNKLKGHSVEGHNTSHCSSSSSSSSSSSKLVSAARHSNSKTSDLEGDVEPPDCRVFTLEPGRLWPSKIHSVDLRTLRFVSYFLRASETLRKHVRTEQPPPDRTVCTADDTYTYMPKPPSASNNSLNSLWSDTDTSLLPNNIDSGIGTGVGTSPGTGTGDPSFFRGRREEAATPTPKISKKALALAAGEGFYIRKGTIVDGTGALAVALMGCVPLGVHFSEVILQVQSMSVPPRLILAALNASIVGIVSYAKDLDERSVGIQRVTLSSRGRSEGGGDGMDSSSRSIGFDTTGSPSSRRQEDIEDGSEFDITYNIADNGSQSGDLPSSLGLGIVRAVDLERQLLYIITPLTPLQLNKCGGRVCIVRGQILIPGVLTYAPDVMPVHPYLSSEVTGEGSNVMKTRNNVKRRSHQT